MKNENSLKKMTNEELIALYRTNPDLQKELTNILYKKNSGLIYTIAKKYVKAYGHRLQLTDLNQIGAVAFLSAIKNYDATQGIKFSSYLGAAVTHEIIKQIGNTGFLVRVPNHIMTTIMKVCALNNEYGITVYNPKDRVKKISKTLSISTAKVEYAFSVRDQFLNYKSLNTPVKDIEDIELIYLIKDDGLSIEEEAINNELPEIIEELINSCLTEREKGVIKCRFWDNLTLENTGKIFNVSGNRVRQIEVKAIRKLRLGAIKKHLADYLYA